MDKLLSDAIELAIHRCLGNAKWWTVSDILFKLNKDGIRQPHSQIIEILSRMVEHHLIEHRVSKNVNTGQQYLEYKLPSTTD